MYILYVDEVGDESSISVPLAPDSTPYFILGGVALHAGSWRSIDRELLALKRKYLRKEIHQWLKKPPVKIAGTPLHREEYYEIKGNKITCPSKAAKGERRLKYISEAMRLIETHHGCIFAYVVKKSRTRTWADNALYTKGLQELVNLLQSFLTSERRGEQALIAIDARKMGQNLVIAASTLSYIFGHTVGRRAVDIVEAPFFVRSELSAGIQLADYTCSLLHSFAHIDHDASLAWSTMPDYSACNSLRGLMRSITFGSDNRAPLGLGWGIIFAAP